VQQGEAHDYSPLAAADKKSGLQFSLEAALALKASRFKPPGFPPVTG